MARQFTRAERVADFIKRELAILLQQEVRDPRVGQANVNAVVVSRDMAHAKVYVTFIGRDSAEDSAEAVKALNHAAGFLRSQLASKSSMRSTPKLRFLFDQSVRSGEYLTKLIDKAIDSDQDS
jgi:ribosome-binding factor A